MDDSAKQIILTIIVLSLLIGFFYTNPFGIKIGYVLSGGNKDLQDDEPNADELQMHYNEYVSTYNLYKDSENYTAAKWAETAKQKANDIARQYNKVMNKNILGEIG